MSYYHSRDYTGAIWAFEDPHPQGARSRDITILSTVYPGLQRRQDTSEKSVEYAIQGNTPPRNMTIELRN